MEDKYILPELTSDSPRLHLLLSLALALNLLPFIHTLNIENRFLKNNDYHLFVGIEFVSF
jgi:hypothetical protein